MSEQAATTDVASNLGKWFEALIDRLADPAVRAEAVRRNWMLRVPRLSPNHDGWAEFLMDGHLALEFRPPGQQGPLRRPGMETVSELSAHFLCTLGEIWQGCREKPLRASHSGQTPRPVSPHQTDATPACSGSQGPQGPMP
jgi:hypothetical protein